MEELAELGNGDHPERRWESGAEILAELEPDRPEVDRHQVAREDAPKDPLLLDDESVDRLVKQRASPEHASEPQPHPNQHRRVREEGRDDTIPDIARVDDTGLERGLDLRLEPGLLVEADL